MSEPNQRPKLKSNLNWNQNWIESEIKTVTESKPNPPPSVVAALPLNCELHHFDYDFWPFPSRRRVGSHQNLPLCTTNTLRPSMSQPTPPPLQISNNPLHRRNRRLVNLYWEREMREVYLLIMIWCCVKYKESWRWLFHLLCITVERERGTVEETRLLSFCFI